MKDIAIIQILRTFSKQELNKFDKFLRSPYFTEGKSISSQILHRYFLILKKFYPQFKDKKLCNEKIYEKLYPGKEYNDGIMRKLNSDLLRLVENFFSYIEFEKNQTDFRHNLLVQLTNRKVEKVYLKKFNEMLAYLNKLERDEDYFYETYTTWNNHFTYYYLSKNMYKLDESLKNSNNFFIYVLLGSLRIYLWALSFVHVINKKIDLYLYDEILKHVKDNYNRYKEIPQILIYYNLIQLISLKDENYFDELRVLKKKFFNILSRLDKYNYFIMMTNFCHDMIQSGKTKYREERFQLDKEFLSTELIDWLGGLHFVHFLTIAKNAIKLRAFKWVENLTMQFYSKIELRYREFALNYIKALINFELEEYDQSLELLSKLKIEYSSQKQYTRNLMIQIYYEKGEDEAVFSLIDTSKHFIHRDKYLNKASRENSLNFIKFTEQILKAKEKSQSYVLKKTKKEISSLINVENKEWLLKKIDELLFSNLSKKLRA